MYSAVGELSKDTDMLKSPKDFSFTVASVILIYTLTLTVVPVESYFRKTGNSSCCHSSVQTHYGI